MKGERITVLQGLHLEAASCHYHDKGCHDKNGNCIGDKSSDEGVVRTRKISEYSAGEGEIREEQQDHKDGEHSQLQGIFQETELDHGRDVPLCGEELEAEVSQGKGVVKQIYKKVNVQEDEPACIHNRQDTQICPVT